MRVYGSLWLLIGPYASSWFLMGLMGPYKSLCVLVDSNGSLWVLMSP